MNQHISCARLVAGGILLTWQAVAGLLLLLGQADALMAYAPDPSWYAAFISFLLKPSQTITIFATLAGLVLVSWSLRSRA